MLLWWQGQALWVLSATVVAGAGIMGAECYCGGRGRRYGCSVLLRCCYRVRRARPQRVCGPPPGTACSRTYGVRISSVRPPPPPWWTACFSARPKVAYHRHAGCTTARRGMSVCAWMCVGGAGLGWQATSSIEKGCVSTPAGSA